MRVIRALVLLSPLLCGVACGRADRQPPTQGPGPSAPATTTPRPRAAPVPPRVRTPAPLPRWLAPYVDVARRLRAAARSGRQAWDRLLSLCDDIGPRLAGSPADRRAVQWAVKTLTREGFENVRAEPVTVPGWQRGRESLELVAPRRAPLSMLGLGFSVGTPPGGITAPVMVVKDEADLKARGETVRGKVVLFNVVMPPYHPKRGTGYGRAARYRVNGAALAARQGAVAALVRSVTARSLQTPHTGMMRYAAGVRKIPTAAVTTEAADLLARFQARSIPTKVRLRMGARNTGPVQTANVVAELRGRSQPDELVVVGCHLDSWDVGTGAHDDGVGCAMAMGALSLLRALKLRPRRTVRLVLWAAEEIGLQGAKEYARAHARELPKHVAAIEADAGGFRFDRLGYDLGKGVDEARLKARLRSLSRLLAPDRKVGLRKGWSGADLVPLRGKNILLLGLLTDIRHYFDVHHSPADTVDKVDPAHLQESAAVLAILAYVLADLPKRPLPAKR